MSDALKTYTADTELATLLRAAAKGGERLRVAAGTRTYELQVTVTAASTSLWEGYDPERVRAAVRRSAALGSSVDPGELEAVIVEICAQRDQASLHPR